MHHFKRVAFIKTLLSAASLWYSKAVSQYSQEGWSVLVFPFCLDLEEPPFEAASESVQVSTEWVGLRKLSCICSSSSQVLIRCTTWHTVASTLSFANARAFSTTLLIFFKSPNVRSWHECRWQMRLWALEVRGISRVTLQNLGLWWISDGRVINSGWQMVSYVSIAGTVLPWLSMVFPCALVKTETLADTFFSF